MHNVFPLFESKGINSAQNGKTALTCENTELQGNVTLTKSRSRVGAVSQTGEADLVVSGVGRGTLLSSVFLFWLYTVIAQFLVIIDHFRFCDSGLFGRGPGQN